MKGLKEMKVLCGYTWQWEKQMRWGQGWGGRLACLSNSQVGKRRKNEWKQRQDEEKELSESAHVGPYRSHLTLTFTLSEMGSH